MVRSPPVEPPAKAGDRIYGVRRELVSTAQLAAPLVVGQVFQVGVGVTDTVMAARLGATELAAVALGSTLWMPIFLACVGLLLGLTPSVAQLRGAGRKDEVGPLYRQGLWLGVAVAVLALVLVLNIGRLMRWIEVDPTVVPVSQEYLRALAWGVPGVCIYLVLRYVGDGVGFTRPIMYVQAAGLLVNALGNYVLMFGKLGFPALGAVGCGWASAVVLWLNAALMLAYAVWHPRFRELRLHERFDPPQCAAVLRLSRLGVPMALTIVMESGLFTAVSLLMGTLGAIAVAAHQIALNYASLMFMVPLGLGMAITVRVGQSAGAGAADKVRCAGFAGMAMSVGTMSVSALVMFLIPEAIVGLYTDEPELLGLAARLLFAAALFQVSDGLQVSALGALRGLKDVTVPLLITFFSYWVVGLPLGYWLGIVRGEGPFGLWAGLIVGLSLAAILLSWRFHSLTRSYSPTAY